MAGSELNTFLSDTGIVVGEISKEAYVDAAEKAEKCLKSDNISYPTLSSARMHWIPEKRSLPTIRGITRPTFRN